MAELKTKQNDASVEDYIAAVTDAKTREDCKHLIALMQEITGQPPKMWGPSIVGFGSYHYRYASGHEGDAATAGFSPRKQNLTIYIAPGFAAYGDLLAKLGKYKVSKSCLYVKRLADIDLAVLRELIARSVRDILALYLA